MIKDLLPSFPVPPQLVILAGQLYADPLARGALEHGLPQPEEAAVVVELRGQHIKPLAQLDAAAGLGCVAKFPAACKTGQARIGVAERPQGVVAMADAKDQFNRGRAGAVSEGGGGSAGLVARGQRYRFDLPSRPRALHAR